MNKYHPVLAHLYRVIFLIKVKKILTVFTIGATLYAVIEILWRGFTHWTMMIAGGISLCGIYGINGALCKKRIISKCALCSLLITLIEFICGVVINIFFKLDVWDYSSKRFNILGQICPLYTFFWFLLSMPAVMVCNFIKGNLFENMEK